MPDDKPAESDQLPEEAPEEQVPDDTERETRDQPGGADAEGREGDAQASVSPRNAG